MPQPPPGAAAARRHVGAGPSPPPPRPAPPNGGRPFADGKACFAGIVYQFRNAVRRNGLPPHFPSGVTCRRRRRDWTAAGVWDRVWPAAPAEPAAARLPDVTEPSLDATLAGSRKGGNARAARAAASA